jgi:protein-tyrosine phosphatase
MNKYDWTGLDKKGAFNAPNITNLRELGGYEVSGGKQIIAGHFYRSGSLAQAKEDDLAALKDMGLQIIVDLRTQQEIASEPDVLPSGCEYYNYSGIVLTETSQEGVSDNLDMRTILVSMMGQGTQLPDLSEYMKKVYRDMALNSDAFRKLFDLIKLYPDEPVLFHCTHGKDRTGIGAALILLSLGASQETVMEDYLVSNLYRQEENSRLLKSLSAYTQDEDKLQNLKKVLEVKEEYLLTFIDTVQQEYGTWQNYFESSLGLTREDLQKMKERYLR